MLTLTRKLYESIIIETSVGNVMLTVTAIKGNNVKISFDAPDEVNIWREEVFEEPAASFNFELKD